MISDDDKGKMPLEDDHQDPKWERKARSVKEEEKKISSSKGGQTTASARIREPIFTGSIYVGRAFSHNMQGPIPTVPDLTFFPAMDEVLRVTDEFCDQYRVLGMEVEILREENERLREIIGRFPSPSIKDYAPHPKE